MPQRMRQLDKYAVDEYTGSGSSSMSPRLEAMPDRSVCQKR